jgi:hypothetical protein
LIFIARLPRSCAIIREVSERSQSEPQFERMEPLEESAPSTCASCQRAIADTYFEAAGRVFCEPCRNAVMASLEGGSGASRLVKALLFGAGAAAVSAVAWYAIVRLTGYELGIIAIAVGFAVGGAVRTGAEHRGGWAYQAIAVLLTYLAIAASYVPMVLEWPVPDGGAGIPLAIAVSLAIPVLQVMHGTGFIGLLIICFALYEAWKINKRQTIAFSGPFRLSRTA